MAKWMKLADNWNALSDEEKESLFQKPVKEVVTQDDLLRIKNLGIMKFRIASRGLEKDDHAYIMTRLPKCTVGDYTIVKPLGFVFGPSIKCIHSFAAATSIKSANGGAVGLDVRVIKTDDKENYDTTETWTFSQTNGEWESGDKWMPIGRLTGMYESDLNKLLPLKRWLGFMFRFRISQPEDTCNLTSFTLNADVQNGWEKMAPGASTFTYSYPTNDTMEVKFFANGDFKVNYDSGYHRKED